jgi:parvulin-like peptidyl-prolyl isomerase
MNPVTKFLTTLLLGATIASANTLVTVNGTAITQNAVDTELMQATQGRFNEVPVEKRAQFRKQVLQQLIAKELVYGDAKKTGVLNSKEFKDEYKKLLEIGKRNIAIQVWQKQQLDKVKVSQKELKDYYNKNKSEFNVKESVHARHILVKEEADAKKIISQLKSLKGDKLKAKFIELAKSKSTGPSGVQGGDLGTFVSGQMVPAFNKEVFSMKVGTVTAKPVKTQFGYHVIYLESKNPANTRSFKEVSSTIEQRIKLEKFKVSVQAKMTTLKKKAKIVVNNKK